MDDKINTTYLMGQWEIISVIADDEFEAIALANEHTGRDDYEDVFRVADWGFEVLYPRILPEDCHDY